MIFFNILFLEECAHLYSIDRLIYWPDRLICQYLIIQCILSKSLVAHISALYWTSAPLFYQYRYRYLLTTYKLFIYFGVCVFLIYVFVWSPFVEKLDLSASPFPSCVAFCDINLTVLHYYAYLIPGQVWNPGFDQPPRSLLAQRPWDGKTFAGISVTFLFKPSRSLKAPSVALALAVWLVKGRDFSSQCVCPTVVKTPVWRIAPPAPGDPPWHVLIH